MRNGKSWGVLAAALFLMITGCQTGKLPVTNSTFMTLWTAYDRCQSSADLETLRADVERLQEGARSVALPKDDVFEPLLRPLEHWITPPTPRLAADVTAMAAACTLHTGELALAFGRTDMAAEMFRSVIHNFSQAQYAFYVDQARQALQRLREPALISLTQAPVVRRASLPPAR